MSKYFVRYSFTILREKTFEDVTKRARVRHERSYIFNMDDDKLSLFEVKDQIYSNDISYLGDERPEIDDIQIITLNKL